MLPNRFPERGEAPEYNSVDALAVVRDRGRRMARRRGRRRPERRRERSALLERCGRRRSSRLRGRHAPRHPRDDDGLLACGEPGVQLTWMDAKLGDWVVTPRIGKPVEVQALWLNALARRRALLAALGELRDGARAAFAARFWNESRGCLYDVVDVDHVAGAVDADAAPEPDCSRSAGCRFALLDGERARRSSTPSSASCWTPLGLRSLAPGEPGYAPRYAAACASATAPTTRAPCGRGCWARSSRPGCTCRRRQRGTAQRARALRRSAAASHARRSGFGHLSEIADGDPPYTPAAARSRRGRSRSCCDWKPCWQTCRQRPRPSRANASAPPTSSCSAGPGRRWS